MAEFTVGVHKYRSGRLNVLQQFHIARRLLPVFSATIGLLKTGSAGLGGPVSPDVPTDGNQLADNMLEPIAHAIAHLSDDDCNYIISTTVTVVHRAVSGDRGYAPIWNSTGRVFMFDDIDLPSLMQIVVAVLEENIGGFLAGSGLPGSADKLPVAGS